MRVKEKVPFSTLSLIPATVSNDVKRLVPKASIEDIVRSFEKNPKLSYISNTLDLLADIVFLFQLEKALVEYLTLKNSV